MKPLQGCRVVELAQLVPGPMCSWYLQGLGAEVVKVEPVTGDPLRYMPPFDDDGIGAWFGAINVGKKSVTMNLKAESDVSKFKSLLANTDVLVEGFRPGVMGRLGLDPAELCEEFPQLVVVSVTGFGQTGPLRTLPGHDLGYCGMAGLLSTAERHGGIPDIPGVLVADIAGGALTSAVGVLGALLERERTGRGQWVDVSMTDGVMPFAAMAFAQAQVCGQPPVPGAEVLTGGFAQYRVYRCKDERLITLAAIEEKFFAALETVVGDSVPRDAGGLAALFSTKDRDEWAALLEGACVLPVLEVNELGDHPLHLHRGTIVGEGKTARIQPPLSGGVTGTVPQLGAHTDSVLSP